VRLGVTAVVTVFCALMELDRLPPPQRIALNYASGMRRRAATAFLLFDRTLGIVVATSSEPILAQVRLAWWRTELDRDLAVRTDDYGTLRALGHTWAGEEAALIMLVDGWERLLGVRPLDQSAIEAFDQGRSACFAALARLAGRPEACASAAVAGSFWALGDLCSQSENKSELEAALAIVRDFPRRSPKLPRDLRHLAILGGLGERALKRGGGPIIRGRRDIVQALRLGMFGR
jgi:phytoene synthase